MSDEFLCSEFQSDWRTVRSVGWITGGYRSLSKASSSNGGRGQESLAALALATTSVTVVLPTPQLVAVDCLLWPQDQARRSISRIFRMVTLCCGIPPPSNWIEGGGYLSYLATTATDRSACSGIAVGFDRNTREYLLYPRKWYNNAYAMEC